jgi:hypothetical protein
LTRNLRDILVASVLVAGLSACGGNGNKNNPPPPPPATSQPPPTPPAPPTPPTGGVAGQISAAFGTIFAANRNSEPRDPAPTDLTVNRTAEPINF